VRKSGPSFDHLVDAGDLLLTTILSAVSRAKARAKDGREAAEHRLGRDRRSLEIVVK
jgi:hypothetical protein